MPTRTLIGRGRGPSLVNTVFQQFLKTVKNSDVPPSPAHATPPLRTPVILLTLNFRHNGSIPGRQPLMRQALHNIYTQRETFHIAVYPAEIESSPVAACLQANTSRFQNIWTARHDFAVHQHRDRPKHSHHRNSSAAPNLLAVCPTLTAQLTNAHFCRAINLFVVWGEPILSAAFQRLRKSYSSPSFPTTAKSPLSDKIIIAPWISEVKTDDEIVRRPTRDSWLLTLDSSDTLRYCTVRYRYHTVPVLPMNIGRARRARCDRCAVRAA